jgi:PKD repeat protein
MPTVVEIDEDTNMTVNFSGTPLTGKKPLDVVFTDLSVVEDEGGGVAQ